MVLKNKDGKLCIKSSRADNKLNKEELENMLMDEEIMGQKDVMTRRDARKLKYTEACAKLYEKNALVEDIKEIEIKNNFDCLDKDETSWKELVRLAKKHHLNYKGTRKQLCERLKNIGYEFRDNDNDDYNIIEIDTIKCYKFKKRECDENVNNCTWLPQIVDRDNDESKRLLINRLKTLDKLNNRPSQNYVSWATKKLTEKLEEYGLNKKGSSCIENPRTIDKIFIPDDSNEVDASLVSQEEQQLVNQEEQDEDETLIDEKQQQSEKNEDSTQSEDEDEPLIDKEQQPNDEGEPKSEFNFKKESKLITKKDCEDFIKIAVEEENIKFNNKLKEINDIDQNICNTEKKVYSEKLTQSAETIKKLEEELKKIKITPPEKSSTEQKINPQISTVSEQLLNSLIDETTDNLKSTDSLELDADSLTSSEEEEQEDEPLPEDKSSIAEKEEQKDELLPVEASTTEEEEEQDEEQKEDELLQVEASTTEEEEQEEEQKEDELLQVEASTAEEDELLPVEEEQKNEPLPEEEASTAEEDELLPVEEEQKNEPLPEEEIPTIPEKLESLDITSSELMDSTSSSPEDMDNVIEVVMESSTYSSEESDKSEENEDLDTDLIETEHKPLVKISSINDNMVEPFDFSEDISMDVKIDFDPKMYTEIYPAV